MQWEYWAGLGVFLTVLGLIFRSSFPYFGWGVTALFISLLDHQGYFLAGVRGDYPEWMLFVGVAVVLFVLKEKRNR